MSPHRYLNTWSSVGATVWGKLMEPLGDAHAEVNMSLGMALRFIASLTSVHSLFLVLMKCHWSASCQATCGCVVSASADCLPKPYAHKPPFLSCLWSWYFITAPERLAGRPGFKARLLLSDLFPPSRHRLLKTVSCVSYLPRVCLPICKIKTASQSV